MRLLDYFNLADRAARSGAVDASHEAAMSIGEQLLIYAGCLVGVLFGAAVRGGDAGTITFPRITMASVVVSAVIALAILPVAFERLAIRPRSPLLFRIGLAVQHGLFWQVLLAAAGRALGTWTR